MQNSSLYIDEGGTGNMAKASKKKKVIVCVNDTLMDNHQVELASSLENEKYIKYAKNLNEITKEVENILTNKIIIKDYPEFNYNAIPNVIYSMLES